MNEDKLKHKRSVMFSLMFIISMVALTTSAIFTILLVHYRTNDLVSLEDSRLLTAAELTRELLGPDYHDSLVDETSVSEEQYRRIVARNDDLCRRLNLQYLWSVLLVDNRFVFTSATHSDLRDPASPCAAFFENHRDPTAFAPAMRAGLTPTFSTFHNEWGEGRMVLIPRKDALGRTYMMGASVQLSERNAMIRRTVMTSAGIGLAVISGAFLFSFVLARSFTVPIARLTEATGRLAAGDFDVSLGQAGTRELDLLAASIDKMRQDLKQYVSELRNGEALLSKSQEIGHIGSWELDLVDNRLTWSQEVYRIFGVLPGVFNPSVESFLEAVHPDDRDAVDSAYSESVREGRDTYEIEHRLVRGDNGEIRFVLEKCEHVKDAGGSIVRSVGMVQDITERKRAEAELRESEERYRSLVETTSDWIWEIDAEARYVYASEKVLDLLGYAPEEVIGRTPFDLMPVPEARRLESQFREIAAKRLPFTALENTNLHKNGRPIFLESSGVPLFGPKGEFRGYRGMDRDITVRKQAEEALRESEERFRLAMEASRDGLWDWNVTTDEVYYSPGYAAMLGYTPGEVPGHVNSWKDLIHPEDKGATLEANVDCIENRRDDFEVEFRMEARNGEWRWILGRGKAVARDRAGRAVRLIGTHTDITERKRAEVKLQEREQRLNFLLTGTPAVIYTCRPSGDYAATFVSGNVQSLLGYPASAFLEDPAFWLNHIHPDDREKVLSGVETLFTGNVHVHEYRFLHQDGTYRWMRDELRLLRDASGRTTEMIGCWIDITGRRTAEDALRASLEEKTVLLKEIHHRVKNNLQIVSSLLNLQADQEKNLPALTALQDTQNRVRSMAMLHEMLYRSESLARINFAAYIEDLSAHLVHAFGADPRRVRLDCRAAAVELGLDQAVPCGLIVNELVSNAIEHAFPEGRSGSVTVELHRDADDRLSLIVADDGVGLPDSLDLDHTSTLGLQLVRVLVTQLKGALSVERGQGTAFHVTFPGR